MILLAHNPLIAVDKKVIPSAARVKAVPPARPVASVRSITSSIITPLPTN